MEFLPQQAQQLMTIAAVAVTKQRQALDTLKWREQEKTRTGASRSATVCKRWKAATGGRSNPSLETIIMITDAIVMCTTASAMHALSHPRATVIIIHKSVSTANGIHTTTPRFHMYLKSH